MKFVGNCHSLHKMVPLDPLYEYFCWQFGTTSTFDAQSIGGRRRRRRRKATANMSKMISSEMRTSKTGVQKRIHHKTRAHTK